MKSVFINKQIKFKDGNNQETTTKNTNVYSYHLWNHDFADAENDWYIQAKRGECAKKMGFDGCLDQDEQGGVYIIPMLERESILVKE